MKIAIDLQGLQSEGSRKRGIGRYSLAFIKTLINEFPLNEYILLANESINDVSSDFKDEILREDLNVVYFKWYSPILKSKGIISNSNNIFAVEKMRTFLFNSLDLDVVLITSFFEGFNDNCFVGFDSYKLIPKVVSIFYDLIPLLNPTKYLDHNPAYKNFYQDKISKLSKLNGLLTISNSALSEAKQYLDFDEEYLCNISSACNRKLFYPSTSNYIYVHTFSKRLGQFILYSGAADLRKNLKGLLQAYSLLPNEILSNYKLVLAGKLIDYEISQIKTWMNDFLIPSRNIEILGYVSDEELVSLYRSCSLFVFPSFHEGFGLPVLEAMSCGAPVIGSNTTSIPEIIPIKEALFNPHEPQSIANLIEKALTNSDFRRNLICEGIKVARDFSWNVTATRTIDFLERIVITQDKQSDDWGKKYSIYQDEFKLFIDELSILKLNSPHQDSTFLRTFACCLDRLDKEIKNYLRFSIDISNNWQIEGPFDSTYSLAILNRNVSLALIKSNQDTRLRSTEGFGDYAPDIKFLSNHPQILDLYNKKTFSKEVNYIKSRNLYPPRVNDMNSHINLLHSYGWEESQFPIEWIKEFNNNLQGITVMSSAVKKILIDNGCFLPIGISNLGLDHIDFNTSINTDNYNLKSFKFLHISSCFPRKGIEKLLIAYGNTFSINDDVSLIIKTFPNPHNNILNTLEEMKNSNQYFPDVLLIQEEMTDDQISYLYSISNCLVAPSYGEGFGLPIAEAMKANVPVITTNWGGQLDFCDESNAWLIDYEFKYSKSHFNLFSSAWAEPCLLKLEKILREVYESPVDFVQEKVKKAKYKVDNLTWEKNSKTNIKFAKNLINKKTLLGFKIGFVSTWNVKCGIASYSKNLLTFIPKKVSIYSNIVEKTLSRDAENVNRCWQLKSESLDVLTNTIINDKISSLIIQFNFGFFDLSALSILIDKLYVNDINIILFLHSTINPSGLIDSKLSNISEALLKCERLIVHTVADMNRLKNIGIVDNVTLFPHGISTIELYNDKSIIKYIKTFFPAIRNNILDMCSFGFCLPNKGYTELIKATKVLLDRGFNVRLTIYSAIYSEEYKYVYLDLCELISKLNLQKNIKVLPDYLSEIDLAKRLRKHDCIVFAYQKSNESSSAAVRTALAYNDNVLTTPIPIFDDVSQVVTNLPNVDVESIADGIYSWYQDKKDFIRLKDKSTKSVELTQWRYQNNFSNVSYRLLGMLQGIEINQTK